jgi:transcriptional regulator with XRE-family HTH domain
VRNHDLVWARESAGWTQEQAAKKMDVRRRTFSRWETGAVSMPNRKWQAFLKLAQVKEYEIPEQRKYDERGFPVGFNIDAYMVEGDFDFVREEAALKALEGAEHKWRARERYRLLVMHLAKGAPDASDQVRRYMAEYDDMADAYFHAMKDAVAQLTAEGLKEVPQADVVARACALPLWQKREWFEEMVNVKRSLRSLEDIGLIVIRGGRVFKNQPDRVAA